MRNKKLLKQYLIKAISLALISCIAVGGMLFFLSSYYLRKEAKLSTQEQLESALYDFSNMIDTMDQVSNQLKVEFYFQPFYVRKNDYNKVLLLERFSMFRNWHPMISNYFLYYPAEEIVFSPTHTYTIPLFSQRFLPENASLTQDVLNQGVLEFDPEADLFYYVIPLRFPGSDSSAQAYLLFEMKKSALKAHYQALYNMGDTLEITWKEVPILAGSAVSERITCSRDLPSGQVSISLDAFSNAVKSEWSVFLRIFAFLIICLMAIAILMAVFTALSIYRPIYRLVRMSGADMENEQNEIEKLAQRLETLHADKENALGQLLQEARQSNLLTNALRRFIFLRILDGEQDEKMEEHSNLVELDLNYPCFQTFYIPYSPDIADDQLRECIENYRTGLVTLFVVRLTGESGWCVVACTHDRTYLVSLEEELEEKLLSQGLALQLYSGSVCVQLKDLPRSLLYAQNAVNEESMEKHSRYTAQLMTLVKNGSRNEAETCLKSIFQNLQSNVQSKLMFRSCLAELFRQLLVVAEDAQCNPADYGIREVLLTGDPKDFYASLLTLIDAICSKNGEENENLDEESIITYIQNHAFENSISLDSIASAFHISTRHLTRLIRNETGATFKEYLTQLRLAKAVDLAKGNLSTAEISEQVGYADKHHFMKLFREQMGCTISQFRSRDQGVPEDEDEEE